MLSGAEVAVVSDIQFGPYDIPTVFFISKSDDANRVDYGLRLDENCNPVGDEPVFPYWREFENSPPVRVHGLKFYEYAAYGVAEQRSLRRAGNVLEIAVRLKPLPRELIVALEKQPDGKCKATVRTTISEIVGAELLSAYVKLKRAWSVEYVEVHGKHPETGLALCERLKQ